MSKNINQLIEEFLSGILNDEDLEFIHNEAKLNPKLAEEIKLRTEINEAIKDTGSMELREIMKSQIQYNNSLYSNHGINRNLVNTWYMAAASFALILVAGGLWYLLSDNPYSTEKLITKYYKPASPILQIRSVEINSDDALKVAFGYYRQNDYSNALIYFNSLNNQVTARFYSGICYIELGEFDKAIESFEFVINDKDNLFVEQADWYLGLIYLMSNDKSNALTQFNKIAGSTNYYADQAEDILLYLN